MPMPEGVYTLFQADGNDAAAVYSTRPGVPVHWGVYFAVASADETAAQVTPSGGKVLAGPFDAHDVGRMAVAQDPEGAMFSLWQAKRSIGATYGGPLGQVMWPELASPIRTGRRVLYACVRLEDQARNRCGGSAIRRVAARRREHGRTAAHEGRSVEGRAAALERSTSRWPIATSAPLGQVQLGGKVCVPPTDIPNTWALLGDH